MTVKEKKSPKKLTAEDQEKNWSLILFNDDFNTFEYVIECLVEVCKHDFMQAENCAMIAHYKGKCPVKNGSYNALKPLFEGMTNRKLTVKIE